MPLIGRSGKIYGDEVIGKTVVELLQMGYKAEDINDFSHITKPRNDMMKYNRPVLWSKPGGFLIIFLIWAYLNAFSMIGFLVRLFNSLAFPLWLAMMAGKLTYATLIATKKRAGRVVFFFVNLIEIALFLQFEIFNPISIIGFCITLLWGIYLYFSRRVDIYLKIFGYESENVVKNSEVSF